MTSIETFLTIRQVIAVFPVSAGTWRNGIKAGIYPEGVKISPRKTVWRKSQIEALILSFSAK